MDGEWRDLVVNLSGDQKSVFGYASWRQLGIVGIGILLGTFAFMIVKFFLKLAGLGLGTQVIVSFIFLVICVAPFAYIAFLPITDDDGNVLYYEYKQLMIDYDFERKEVGTYLNLQPALHPVGQAMPWMPKRFKEVPPDEQDDEDSDDKNGDDSE